jgi:hypothetical protein
MKYHARCIWTPHLKVLTAICAYWWYLHHTNIFALRLFAYMFQWTLYPGVKKRKSAFNKSKNKKFCPPASTIQTAPSPLYFIRTFCLPSSRKHKLLLFILYKVHANYYFVLLFKCTVGHNRKLDRSFCSLIMDEKTDRFVGLFRNYMTRATSSDGDVILRIWSIVR